MSKILGAVHNYKYFYDKINNIGFPIYVDNDYDIKQVYNGKESQRYISELISISKGVSTYKIKNKKSEKLLLIKKISEDIYIYLSVKEDDSSILEKFYKDFMENL